MHEHPLLQRLKLLLASLAGLATKHQLRAELPLERDLVVLLHLLVHNGVVVLKVGAKTFGLEGDPQRKLVHGVGVLGPVAEVVSVDGEALAQILDGLGVFEEKDLVACVSAHVRLGSGGMTIVGQHELVVAVGLRAPLYAACMVDTAKDFENARRDGKTYCSVCGLEAAQLLLGLRPTALGHHGLQRLAHKVPERVMVLVEQHHETTRLRVEG
jgi:hypothetical protein